MRSLPSKPTFGKCVRCRKPAAIVHRAAAFCSTDCYRRRQDGYRKRKTASEHLGEAS